MDGTRYTISIARRRWWWCLLKLLALRLELNSHRQGFGFVTIKLNQLDNPYLLLGVSYVGRTHSFQLTLGKELLRHMIYCEEIELHHERWEPRRNSRWQMMDYRWRLVDWMLSSPLDGREIDFPDRSTVLCGKYSTWDSLLSVFAFVSSKLYWISK